jgi:hypothetical protein
MHVLPITRLSLARYALLALALCATSARALDWAYPQPLNNNAATDGNRNDYYPSIANDGNGTWVAAWASQDFSGAGGYGTDMDIFFARSLDDGATWSTPAIVDPAAASDNLADSNPAVYTDGTGHWLMVWGSWDSGGASDIDLLYVVSTNGLSWSAPAHFNSDWETDIERDHDDTPQIAADPSGHWVAVWMKGKDYGDEHDIYVSHSDDHGLTWAPVAYLHSSMETDLGNDIVARIASDQAGNLVVVWRSDNLIGTNGIGDPDIHYSRSDDGGATWTAPAALNTDALTDGLIDIEGTVGTDRAGHWAAAWYRDNTGLGSDRDILFARSTDNGLTWTAPQPLNTNWATGTGNNARPRLVADGTGNWVAVWYSNETLGLPIGSDPDVFYARSADDGATWTPPAVLNGNAATDMSAADYSHEIALGLHGRLLTAWYTNDSLGGTIGTDRDILFATACLARRGDRDCDGDVDLYDYQAFQACFATGNPVSADCSAFDFDDDGDVELDDYGLFLATLDGPA